MPNSNSADLVKSHQAYPFPYLKNKDLTFYLRHFPRTLSNTINFCKKYKIHPIYFFSFLSNNEFECKQGDPWVPHATGGAAPLVTERHNKKGGGRI
jgi:hypothetical protein